MIRISSQNVGLGKSKFLRKITLKGAIKGVKALAPMAISFIPVAGGPASGIAEKLLKSKAGKLAVKVSKSKVGKAVKKIAKTDVAKNAFASAKTRVLGNDTLPANYTDHSEPAGEVMAVKPVEPAVAPAKNNTMLYAGVAVAVVGIGYLATRKK